MEFNDIYLVFSAELIAYLLCVCVLGVGDPSTLGHRSLSELYFLKRFIYLKGQQEKTSIRWFTS